MPLVVHGLEPSVALILAEEVEGHMTKSTVGSDAVLVAFIFDLEEKVDEYRAAVECVFREQPLAPIARFRG